MYQQKAAEYRALCYQAYNIARLRIDTYKTSVNKPLAIITDIDETILDNSPYAAYRGLQGKDYESASWYEWTDKSAADTMPGAGSFLKYAAARGIEIFYVTNREQRERISTLKNLQRFALPNADDAHLLSRVDVSSKEKRRIMVSTTHNIVLLMGDNLADFSSLFDKKPQDERQRNTDLSASEFGNRFIIFPNPVYGDWEAAVNKYNYTLNAAQKDSIIKQVLKTN
jgi:5'-nucleotidase (lipoprotein e(P4) family)